MQSHFYCARVQASQQNTRSGTYTCKRSVTVDAIRRPCCLLQAMPAQSARGGRAPSNDRAEAVVERLDKVTPEIDAAVASTLGSCLTDTALNFGSRTQGKVRDTYDMGDKLIVITTDRQSAFDRMVGAVPFKGQVLNETSAWWMKNTSHIAPNALLAVPDPNAAIMLKCTPIPVEFVVRGFMTGSTETSLWTLYRAGGREFGGNRLPDGICKNDRLENAIITPTTKGTDHDVPITPAEIVAQGLMAQEDWNQVSRMALGLFHHGQAEAASRGLILVDTKYEFGMTTDGKILLIDEIHTPDSSRYWIASSYEARHANKEDPQSIDKEFLRLWFRAQCDPYVDKVLPPAPPEMLAELSRRYITLFEKITGRKFQPADTSSNSNARIAHNVLSALKAL